MPIEDLQTTGVLKQTRVTADYRLRAVMGLAKLFEGGAGLGSAKEGLHVPVVGKAEHG